MIVSLRRTLEGNLFREFQAIRLQDDPVGYNQKVKWMMMHDQMIEHIICCNKLLCRRYVSKIVGEDILLDLYGYGSTISELEYKTYPRPFVLKATHDSGSVFVVRELSDLKRHSKKLKKRMLRTFGLEKGEWAYSHVVPLVIAEQFMEPPIVDYKFHCCGGDIAWVQVISDRELRAPKEVIVDASFERLPLHMDENFILTEKVPERPLCWDDTIST